MKHSSVNFGANGYGCLILQGNTLVKIFCIPIQLRGITSQKVKWYLQINWEAGWLPGEQTVWHHRENGSDWNNRKYEQTKEPQ